MIGKIIIHLMTSKIKARKVNCPSCTKSMYNYNLQRHLKTCIKNKFYPICQKDISEGSINEHVAGACTGFLKGVGEESARSAGFEAAASRGPGAQPPENF